MNLASLDLNLLVALDALVSEAHVGRAASRVNLSQPAMSHALRRLRDLLNDPLLVRVGAAMELTPRAQSLRAPLSRALDQVRDLLAADSFDPAGSSRRFSIVMPDHLVDLIVPALIKVVSSKAPGVRLDILPWLGSGMMSAESSRSIDLVVACAAKALAGFERQRLFSDTEAIAVRRGHPAVRKLNCLEDFMNARHVAVVGRGMQEDPVDTWLREIGIERSIALAVPGYLQALQVACCTDLVAFVPKRLIEALERPLLLTAVAPPLDPGEYEEFLFYPSRAQVDAGSLWLRRLVLEVGRTLDRHKNRSGSKLTA